MKIFTFTSSVSDAPDNILPGASVVWPDSCWLLSRRPLYIPDSFPHFMAIPALAIKMGRLGKCIPQCFATRYMGEITGALIILPEMAVKDLALGKPLHPFLYCFDNAVVIGDWRDNPVFPASMELEQKSLREDNGKESMCMIRIPSVEESSYCIAEFSRYNTIKMGDVLLMPDFGHPVDLYEDLNIRIRLDSEILLSTRFK